MNEYRLILPGGDRAMNNKCRFSIHSWYYMYDDDDDDDSEEVLNDIAQIWGKLEKKVEHSTIRNEKKNCIAFHIIFPLFPL